MHAPELKFHSFLYNLYNIQSCNYYLRTFLTIRLHFYRCYIMLVNLWFNLQIFYFRLRLKVIKSALKMVKSALKVVKSANALLLGNTKYYSYPLNNLIIYPHHFYNELWTILQYIFSKIYAHKDFNTSDPFAFSYSTVHIVSIRVSRFIPVFLEYLRRIVLKFSH
jgi:hypothetical protein